MKGGAAWERDNFNVFNNVTLATLAVSGDRRGWTVGVGGEYAFTDYLAGFVETRLRLRQPGHYLQQWRYP